MGPVIGKHIRFGFFLAFTVVAIAGLFSGLLFRSSFFYIGLNTEVAHLNAGLNLLVDHNWISAGNFSERVQFFELNLEEFFHLRLLSLCFKHLFVQLLDRGLPVLPVFGLLFFQCRNSIFKPLDSP